MLHNKYKSLYYLSIISTTIDKNYEIVLSSSHFLKFVLKDSTFFDDNNMENHESISVEATIQDRYGNQVFSILFTKLVKCINGKSIYGIQELNRCNPKEKLIFIFTNEINNHDYLIGMASKDDASVKKTIKGLISNDDLKEIDAVAYCRLLDIKEQELLNHHSSKKKTIC